MIVAPIEKGFAHAIAEMMRNQPSLEGSTAYLGGLLTLVCLTIPDETWEKLITAAANPCETEGCDCHKYKENLFLALSAIRMRHTEMLSKHA